MKNKLIVLLISICLFIPFVYAENETIDENIEVTNDLEQTVETDTIEEPEIDTSLRKFGKKSGEYELLVDDEAGLLTPQEREDLTDYMQPLLKYGNVVFKTSETNHMNVETFSMNYYKSLYGTENGSVFVIDMGTRKLCIASQGKNQYIITNDKSDIITDNVFRYATRGEYFECAKRTFEQMNTLLEGGKISEPMRYASNIVLSLVIGFFVGFFRILSTSKIKSSSSSEVLDGCDIKFDIANIVAVKTGTHKVYSPPSSSSGVSGGGGGGFSGGGGGGGSSGSHSF